MERNSANLKLEIEPVDAHSVRSRHVVGYTEQNGFLLCHTGTASLTLDDKTYDLGPRGIYIFPAFSQSDVLSCSDDFAATYGTADFDFVLNTIESVPDPTRTIYIRFHPHVHLSPVQYDRLMNLIDLMTRRRAEPSPLVADIVASMVGVFCLEVIDAYIQGEQGNMTNLSRQDSIFYRFLVAVHKNCRQHRDVRFYAEQLNLTPRYFSTLVRQTSGQTPMHWITHFVILEAKRLLTSPQRTVKEVAALLNFPDQSFFGRYFHQYAGLTPTEFKKRRVEISGE